MITSIGEMKPIVSLWVRENELDEDLSGKYSVHDTLHVLLGLSHREEGIVLAVEIAVSDSILPPSWHEFLDNAILLSLETDSFEVTRVREIYDHIVYVWPITLID